MDKEKLKDKWFDLTMKQYYLQKDIEKELDIQQKSLLELDLSKVNKKLNKVEEKLFTKEEKENTCRTCKYGLQSYYLEPCNTCLNSGVSQYKKKEEFL